MLHQPYEVATLRDAVDSGAASGAVVSADSKGSGPRAQCGSAAGCSSGKKTASPNSDHHSPTNMCVLMISNGLVAVVDTTPVIMARSLLDGHVEAADSGAFGGSAPILDQRWT